MSYNDIFQNCSEWQEIERYMNAFEQEIVLRQGLSNVMEARHLLTEIGLRRARQCLQVHGCLLVRDLPWMADDEAAADGFFFFQMLRVPLCHETRRRMKYYNTMPLSEPWGAKMLVLPNSHSAQFHALFTAFLQSLHSEEEHLAVERAVEPYCVKGCNDGMLFYDDNSLVLLPKEFGHTTEPYFAGLDKEEWCLNDVLQRFPFDCWQQRMLRRQFNEMPCFEHSQRIHSTSYATRRRRHSL